MLTAALCSLSLYLSIIVLSTYCNQARPLVLVPQHGCLYYLAVYHGVPRIFVDGKLRSRVSGRGEVVSHVDKDKLSLVMYYVTRSCENSNLPCLFGRDPKTSASAGTFISTLTSDYFYIRVLASKIAIPVGMTRSV